MLRQFDFFNGSTVFFEKIHFPFFQLAIDHARKIYHIDITDLDRDFLHLNCNPVFPNIVYYKWGTNSRKFAIFLCDIAKNALPSPQFSIIVDKNKAISRFEIQYAAIANPPGTHFLHLPDGNAALSCIFQKVAGVTGVADISDDAVAMVNHVAVGF